jgi:hypothetical protein
MQVLRVEEAHVLVLYGPLLIQVVRVEEAHMRVLHPSTSSTRPQQRPSVRQVLVYSGLR